MNRDPFTTAPVDVREIRHFHLFGAIGGGAKGFYTLGVLKEIEAMVGCPLHQKFDLVFGTSTGAIIASLIALGHDVCAQALAGFQRVGEWFDAGGVDGLHLVDQPQNTVQGISGAWQIAFIQAQTGQMSNLFHVAAFKRHEDLQGKQRTEFGSAMRNMSAFWRSNGRDHRLACSEKQPI